jgi:hypothetical protein
MGFAVDKMALGQVFFQVLRVSSVNIIPPVLYIHPHLNLDVVLT